MTIETSTNAQASAAQSADILYACNLGAGGIDYRCAKHLWQLFADAINADADLVTEYVPVDAAEGLCEACPDDDTADLHCDHAGGLCRQDVGAECDTPPLVRITHPECFR